MSLLNVDKLDPNSGTALEIGTSGDTVTVPSGVGLTLTDSTLLLPTTITSTTEVKTNKISPATGTAFALGDSGDTFTVPSGATFANLGTATGFAAISWQAVTTGSTLTAVAGNGYPIDTTSNTCTITLPASASVGDQLIFLDYARTWGTNKIILDSNGLNYQGQDDTYTVEYDTDGETLNIVYADATKGWIPLNDDDVTDAPTPPPTQKAIYGYGGSAAGTVSMTNLVSSSGVVATDTTGVGTARQNPGAACYGTDKAIFAYGYSSDFTAISNLVSNSGVVATDVSGVGTARNELSAAGYGLDKAIFAYGNTGSDTAISNLVSSSGVIASDVSGVGTARRKCAAAGYSTDKAIFAYGVTTNISNLVSNVGVVASDTTGVGTARYGAGAARYGGDKAIFAYGNTGSKVNMSNLVTNVGVVGTDVTGVGTAREDANGGAGYGGDKAIFAYGHSGSYENMSNLVTNLGVVGTDVTGVGTARFNLAATGYSLSA